MNNYGLLDKEMDILKQLFSNYKTIDKVVLYGSRAKGSYRPFSDVDITLVGDNISLKDLLSLSDEIDEQMPYRFDISIYKNLKNENLKDHIRRRGITIYEA